jgi:hypothetical protein
MRRTPYTHLRLPLSNSAWYLNQLTTFLAVGDDTKEVMLLLQFSPAECERYFHELSEPAEYLGLPPAPSPTRSCPDGRDGSSGRLRLHGTHLVVADPRSARPRCATTDCGRNSSGRPGQCGAATPIEASDRGTYGCGRAGLCRYRLLRLFR